METANVIGPGGVPVQGSEYAADLTMSQWGPLGSYLQNNHNSEREKDLGIRTLLKARPSNTGPTAGEGSPLTTCGNPVGDDHSIPALLCWEK